jgi:hypothetical protein
MSDMSDLITTDRTDEENIIISCVKDGLEQTLETSRKVKFGDLPNIILKLKA